MVSNYILLNFLHLLRFFTLSLLANTEQLSLTSIGKSVVDIMEPLSLPLKI